MHANLLLLHSVFRYFVLIFLIILIVRSYLGWSRKADYSVTDNKLSLWLLILTHTQFLLGLVMYLFTSSAVQFGPDTMKDATIRYWTVEHIFMMIIAVALITAARSTSKKLTETPAKHKRLFILNLIALVVIVVGIAGTGRGFFSLAGY